MKIAILNGDMEEGEKHKLQVITASVNNIVLIILLLFMLFGCKKSTNQPPAGNSDLLHEDITVTVFWIGEEGSEENGYIPNIQSAWDDKWMDHYGGLDNPLNRNGYLPGDFTPMENPFYFALPYNDFNSEGNRKSSAFDIVYWAKENEWDEMESMCKNRWIKIIKGEKVAYAQWEDVGPFGEDDSQYVFGNDVPQNEINNDAGLDVSPAVRDYLGLEDIDNVNWHFIDFDEIPDGPWKNIITDSQIYWE